MTPAQPKSDQAAGPMPIAWALAVPKLRDAWTAFEREKADAACLQSGEDIEGLELQGLMRWWSGLPSLRCWRSLPSAKFAGRKVRSSQARI